jgi:hypothetical protein
MMSSNQKVYDYDVPKVRDRLVDVFRKRKGEATTADLIALTGLPKTQVETEIKAVSDEYGARLRVTDSGEILYSFPSGMKSRYRGFGPSFSRFWKAFRKGAAAVGSFLFKIWIVVMLVGYFVFFIGLALLALLVSLAAQFAGKDNSGRGDGIGGFYLASSLIDTMVRIWFYSELFTTPEERAMRRGRRRDRKPLHKAIYSFVFGDGDPNADWDTVEKKAFVAFVQANKGLISMPEFMALTGLPPLEAEERINRYLYEFEGSPEVSDGGTIYFAFPGLLRRKDKADRTFGGTTPMKRIAAFSSNKAKANRTFCLFNGVNLVFGSYFLAEALTPHNLLAVIYGGKYASKLVTTGGWDGFYYFTHQLFGKLGGMADPTSFIAIVLGLVPLVFGLFFYAIPAIRKGRLDARNERARTENLRRVAYRAVIDSPSALRPESVSVLDEAARPKDGRAAEKTLTELAAWSGAEPRADGSFRFDEIERGKGELAKVRAAVNISDYDLGGVNFDSGAPAN